MDTLVSSIVYDVDPFLIGVSIDVILYLLFIKLIYFIFCISHVHILYVHMKEFISYVIIGY